MVEITKPDGEVIHRHNQHHNTTSANVHMNLGLNLSKNQECGTEGDFLSWSKVMFLHFSSFLFVCIPWKKEIQKVFGRE